MKRPLVLAGRCAPLILLALGGCIELSPIAPPSEQDAVLHLSLRLTDVEAATDEGALLIVAATLETGVDGIGRTRGIVDDTLIVFGQPVPAADQDIGRAIYSASLLLDRREVLDGRFEVRAPVVKNLPPFTFGVRWPLLAKAGPQPVEIEPGEDLVLPLAFEGFPGQPAPQSQRWSLAVFREDGWFSQGASGLPPDRVVVPAALLGTAGTAMVAILTMTTSLQVEEPDGSYDARVELAQELRWTIQIAGPPAERQVGGGERAAPHACAPAAPQDRAEPMVLGDRHEPIVPNVCSEPMMMSLNLESR